MKKIRFMDVSFRDGIQSCLGARVQSADFFPALEAGVDAGTDYFEIGGGGCFQSFYFYCQEDAFDMMDRAREIVGPNVTLETLARGANVVGLVSQSRDIIKLHAQLFKKHGMSAICNFDALNDVRNLAYSGQCIHDAGLEHQVTITMMGLPPNFSGEGAHTPQFYVDRVKEVLKHEIPFDSICFKDASGTCSPKTVFETVKEARKILPAKTSIQIHTHDTAGMGIACYMAAIEAGADVIDLAMSPVSGGSSLPDILTMWHCLKGSGYTLDIDHEKILQTEALLRDCLSKYFMPPESKEVSPLISFSLMPGGALTTNTQMMRDNNCLELYPKVIDNMPEVVAKGGYGTSVTPISQFYFQQAFANATQGKWKKITDGYGKMVLGYFGKTPRTPDSQVVKIASEQLGLAPTNHDIHDINDRNFELGIKAATEKLTTAGLKITDENIFITATCGEKGIQFLKGNKPLRVRLKEDVEKSNAEHYASTKTATVLQESKTEYNYEPSSYSIVIDGKQYDAHIAPAG